MFYFAYGANTNIDGMAYRCPDAEWIGTLALPDYRLVFRGVADIEPRTGSAVQGVLWDITDECERSLDRFEGYPNHYTKEYFAVSVDGCPFTAMFYTMQQKTFAPPSYSYRETIRQGYKDNCLPLSYLLAAIDDSEMLDKSIFHK